MPNELKPQEDSTNAKTDQDTYSEASLEEMAEQVSEVVGQSVNPEQMARLIGVTHSFASPLPPPELLREYVEILDGENGGDRIVKMAEREQEHRHHMDRTEIEIETTKAKGDVNRASRGQWMFYSAIMVFSVGGLIGLFLDKPLAGFGGLGGAVLAALTGIFGPKLSGLAPKSGE